MNRLPRLLFLPCALALLGCEPVLSAETFKLVPLPPDLQTGPATVAVQTKEGRVFATPSSGGFLRLAADGGAWEDVPAPAMLRYVPDLKDGLSLGLGASAAGVFRASGDAFIGFEPPVPVLGDFAFSNVGWSALLGRDATGVFWATAAPTFGSLEGRVFVAHLDPGATEWIYEEVPIASRDQSLPASKPAMTSDARFFFRPHDSGIWEIDLPNHVVVERVPCEHELFRPSHADYVQCQEDTLVFAGRGGELFILNPNRELWRVPSRGTTPVLVVKGELPKLDKVTGAGFNRYSPGGPQTYVDPKGRVWLGFRWGENVESDTSYLYVAEPAKSDAWTFLKNDLPRNIALFGDGNAPLLSSGSQNTGLVLFRVAE